MCEYSQTNSEVWLRPLLHLLKYKIFTRGLFYWRTLYIIIFIHQIHGRKQIKKQYLNTKCGKEINIGIMIK